jgi:hypothetical protein
MTSPNVEPNLELIQRLGVGEWDLVCSANPQRWPMHDTEKGLTTAPVLSTFVSELDPC